MANKYWFRPKRFGYGLEPISWEGWLATLVFIAALLHIASYEGLFTDDPNLKRFFFDLALLIVVFFHFAKDRTLGEMKWNWGIKKRNKKTSDE